MGMTDMHNAASQERRVVSRSTMLVLLFAVSVVGLSLVSMVSVSGAPGCDLTSPAFCETFDQGPSSVRGRGGDLDPSRWSTARLAPSDMSGSVANPVRSAPIPPCKASFPQTSAFPPDDTLICDPSGNRSAQLMTAVAIQNYGNNSYMIRQPFDFAGRTGKIVFDVDAASGGNLSGWVGIDITQDPVPAPTFREFENFEPGPVPRNGLMMKWSEICGQGNNYVTLGNVMVYRDYAPTMVTPTFNVTGGNCAKTQLGSLNHFEVRVSQTQLEIYGSDFSNDNGNTFPNFRRLYAANINLGFTRGYVHVSARNHATVKYGFGEDWVFHWDNIGFDGPALPAGRGYEIPNNNTSTTHDGAAMRNLGYQLHDGTVSGKPAGMYNPSTRIAPFSIAGVNLTGVVDARLTLNAFFNTIGHTASTSWGLSYRFNGGTLRTRMLTALEVQSLNIAGSAGNVALVIDVPVGDVAGGANTLELLPIGAPMDLVPSIANIDLVLGVASGPPPSAPSNLKIIR
jgi:hypothetical protein